MQSLQDIFGNKYFDQPPEIEIIKTFIRKNFSSDANIRIQQKSITIIVSSASLAGALRQVLHQLQKELETDKKLFIRIG